MAFLALLIFIGVFGGMGFAMYKVLKKTDPKKLDTSTIDNITTAQEFLPFEDIRDGMIVMGGHKYRAIIECSSTNYNLKTGKEKEIIEISFQRFLNSLTFPVTFFVQTKIIDNSHMMTMLKDELLNTIEQYPQLEEYAENYFDKMSNLNSHIGNNVQKKKYIIVPYEDAVNIVKLSDEEKYNYSSKELYTRASMIVENLASVGVKAKILNTAELYELIYTSYNKDGSGNVDDIISGGYFSLVTENPDARIHQIPDDAKLDLILYEAQMRIHNELLGYDVPEFLRRGCEQSIFEIDKIRDNLAGYYKSPRVSQNEFNEEEFNKFFSEQTSDSDKEGDE